MKAEIKTAKIAAVCLAVIALILNIDRYAYVNVTGSLPRGLYLAIPGELHRGDYVIYKPSSLEKKFLAERNYSDADRVLLKQVGGIENDTYTVTRQLEFYINNERKGEIIPIDDEGRFMPYVVGCHYIRKDEFLPYAPAKRSLDGRYFGPENKSQIISKVVPIITEIW